MLHPSSPDRYQEHRCSLHTHTHAASQFISSLRLQSVMHLTRCSGKSVSIVAINAAHLILGHIVAALCSSEGNHHSSFSPSLLHLMRSLSAVALADSGFALPSFDIPAALLWNATGIQGGLNQRFVAYLSQSESNFVLSVLALKLNENNKWCPYLQE